MAGENHFTALDYIVSVGSIVICLIVGVYYAHQSPNTNEDLLVGGRNMKILPVAASIMVSFVSAITTLGYPAEIYAFGIEIFMMTICQGLGIVVAAFVMIPFFYPLQLTSIYDYLERRYDSVALRRLGASLFILEQVCLGAMIIYAPCIALESFLGLPLWISIGVVSVSCALYTSVGGLKAVVWTDTFQFLVMVTGLLGIVIKCFVEVGVVNAFSLAADNGRLNLFNFTVDPFLRHNTLNFILGSGLVTAIRTGVHQVQVQRYMSLPSLKNAKSAVLLSAPLKFGVMFVMMLTGVGLYAKYATCDPIKSGKMKNLDQIVTTFITEELAHIPGVLGVFTAGIFSAVLSSLSSQLNSLAAITWEDFLSGMPLFKNMSPSAQTNVSRFLSLLYGILAMSLAYIVKYMGAIYAASFAVTGAVTGAIIAVFSMAIFMPFINKMGASIGTFVALLAMVTISSLGFIYKPNKNPLPVSTEGCAEIITTMTAVGATVVESPGGIARKIASLSYILYPFVGLIIGILTGILVSAITGGFKREEIRRIKPEYLHPWVRGLVVAEQEKHQEKIAQELKALKNGRVVDES